MTLIDSLIAQGYLRSHRLIRAFKDIKRADFMTEETKDLAELNQPMTIGYGQTISQPLVVAFMLELLQPRPGDKILDVGAGSGWTTALLAHIVSQKGNSKLDIPISKQITNSKSQIPSGKVIAIEVIPELKDFGEKNVAKYNFIEKGIVKFVCGDGSKGYSKEAPFDKILASASAKVLPSAWKEQLKVGGRIVTPIGTSIWLFVKRTKNTFKEVEYPGFVFVPLVNKNAK